MTGDTIERLYYGVLKKPNGTLETILVRTEKQGEIITIDTVHEQYSGFSYREDNFTLVSDNIGSLMFCFLHNRLIDTSDYFIGFWNSTKAIYKHKDLPNAGRIIVTSIRSASEEYKPKSIGSVSAESLTLEINDYNIIKGIYKYFYPSKGRIQSGSIKEEIKEGDKESFNKIFETIELIKNKFTEEIEGLRGTTDKINDDLEELKIAFLEKFKIEGTFEELKFMVAKGEANNVLNKLKEFLNPKKDKEIYNDYLLLFASFSKLRDNQNNGVLSFENISIESNRINKALLSLIDKIEEINQVGEINK